MVRHGQSKPRQMGLLNSAFLSSEGDVRLRIVQDEIFGFFSKEKECHFSQVCPKCCFLVVTLAKFQSVRGASHHGTLMGQYLFLCPNFPVHGFILFHFCCLSINVEISCKKCSALFLL